MNAVDWALLLFLAAVWGSSFFFGKVAEAGVTPLTLVAARTLIACPALILVMLLSGYRFPRDWAHWKVFLGMGLLNCVIPFSLIFTAMTHIQSGLAAVLNSTTPIFGVILAHFIASERLTLPRIFGALCGFAGVALMIGLEALHGIGDNVLAEVAVIGAAFCYAANAFYARRVKHVPPLVSAAGMVTAAAFISVPLAVAIDKPWQAGWPNAATIWSLLSLGLLSTALAYLLYFRLLRSAGPSNLVLVTFLIPVSAILLGVGFLHEILTATQVGGLALIAAGLLLIDGRISRLWVRSTPA